MTATETVPAVAPRRHCRLCGHGNTGDCDKHQIPPVCICDQPTPGWWTECGACRRPHGPQFAEVRAAWREHLTKAVE